MRRYAWLAFLLMSSCVPIRLQLGVDPEVVAAAAKVAPEAPAVMLHDETFRQLRWDQTAWWVIEEVHRAIQINDAGVAEMAHVRIPYSAGAKIKRFEGRIHLPNGRVKEVAESRILDREIGRSAGKPAVSFRARTFAFPEAGPGAIIEFHYAVTYPVAQLRVLQQIPDGIPVIHSQHSLRVEDTVQCRTRQQGFDAGLEKKFKSGRQITWTLARPIRSSGYEPASEPPGLRNPWLVIQCHPTPALIRLLFKDLKVAEGAIRAGTATKRAWKDLSDKVAKTRSEDRDADIPIPEIETSTSALGRSLEAIVRTAERHFDVRAELVLDGPTRLDEIVARGFGGSIAAARLLLALLGRAGIQASLVMVPATDMPDPAEGFAWWGLFDGYPMVLVESKQGTWWIDPTCRGCPVGMFNDDHQGRAAVIFHPATTEMTSHVELAEIPWQWAPKGEFEQRLTLAADAEDLRVIEGIVRFRGRLAAYLRIRALDTSVTDDQFLGEIRQRVGLDLERGTIELVNLGNRRTSLTAKLRDVPLRPAGYIATEARTWFSLADLFPIAEFEGMAAKRRGPIRFAIRPTFQRTLNLQIAPDQTVVTAPEPIHIDDPLGTYALEVAQTATGLQIIERFDIKERRLPVERYEALRAFVGRVLDARRAPVGIERKPR